jgi:hypothetical protein
LTRYAFLFESIVLSDGSTLVPANEEGAMSPQALVFVPTLTFVLKGLGLKATIELIDNRGDFKTYMQNYAFARGGAVPRGPRRDGPQDEGFVSIAVFCIHEISY